MQRYMSICHAKREGYPTRFRSLPPVGPGLLPLELGGVGESARPGGGGDQAGAVFPPACSGGSPREALGVSLAVPPGGPGYGLRLDSQKPPLGVRWRLIPTQIEKEGFMYMARTWMMR